MPWEVTKSIEGGISDLRKMAEECIIRSENVGDAEEAQTTTFRIESAASWPNLSKHFEQIQRKEFSGVVLSTSHERNMETRGQSDFGDVDFLTTLQSWLQSLCKHTAKVIEDRTVRNLQNPYPTLITVDMAGCLDLQSLYEACQSSYALIKSHGNISLQNVMNAARIPPEQQTMIMLEYQVFKERFIEVVEGSCSNALISYNETYLFQVHECTMACGVTARQYTRCKDYMKIVSPRKLITAKFLHLLTNFEDLFIGIENFLHFFLRCSVKTHAEAVAESMGNYIDCHSKRKRGLDIAIVVSESRIHWNGPPLHKANALIESALDRHFGGKIKLELHYQRKQVRVVYSHFKNEEETLQSSVVLNDLTCCLRGADLSLNSTTSFHLTVFSLLVLRKF